MHGLRDSVNGLMGLKRSQPCYRLGNRAVFGRGGRI